MTTAEDEAAIRTSVTEIAAAVTTRDLPRYGRQVTDDFVEMNRDLEGRMTYSVGRQARLDVLQAAFDGSPWNIEAVMDAAEVAVGGNNAFARVDGTLVLTPRSSDGGLRAHSVSVDISLFYCRDDDHGWLIERSMAVERSRTDR